MALTTSRRQPNIEGYRDSAHLRYGDSGKWGDAVRRRATERFFERVGGLNPPKRRSCRSRAVG